MLNFFNFLERNRKNDPEELRDKIEDLIEESEEAAADADFDEKLERS